MSGTGVPDAAKNDLPEELVEQAIEWAVKIQFSSADETERQAFSSWLNCSPRHEEAWQRIQSISRESSHILPENLSRTLATFNDRRQKQRQQRRKILKLLLIGGFFASSGLLTYRQAPWQRLLADNATETGQQQVTTLEDGSILRLNTDSAVAQHYDVSYRKIELLRGEISITTGKDTRHQGRKRPFVITTSYGNLEALGTRFTVRLYDGHARIDVQDGAVRMVPAGGMPSIIRAGSGGLLTREKATPTQSLPYDPDGWTDGVLAVRKMRLQAFLDELSRYRMGKIVCTQDVADLPVSGIYHLVDTDKALRFLQQTQPIKIAYRTRYWVSVSTAERSSAK